MPTYSIDPLYPPWFRCDLSGSDVAEVLPAEALDFASLTAGQVTNLYTEAAAEIDAHEHRCRAIAVVNANGRK